MRDPYLYDDSTVLKNKLDIRDQETLEGAEANYVSFRLGRYSLSGDPRRRFMHRKSLMTCSLNS